jgi:DNA invertase Pin-like site-specific DNA recombinase
VPIAIRRPRQAELRVVDPLTYALVYRRVSGAEHQRRGYGLQAQSERIAEYIGRQTQWVVAGEFVDILTGKRADRPEYQAMLAEARRLSAEGKRVAVVVIHLDRLGRNKPEYFRAAEELSKMGAVVHSVRHGGPLDEEHAGILAVFAAKEARDIGNRVREVRTSRVGQGWHYGRTPFGYTKRPSTMLERQQGAPEVVMDIDPHAAPTVAEAFRRVAQGVSVRQVAIWLQSLPDEQRGGRTWPGNSVIALLCSPTYIARPIVAGDDASTVLERPRGHWEPIVTDEMWTAVHERLAQPRAGQQRRPHTRYLLSGLLRCPLCGYGMNGQSAPRKSRPGQVRRAYRCSSWAKGAERKGPPCYYEMSAELADALIVDTVAALLEPFSGLGDRVRHVWAQQQQAERDTQIDRERRQLRKERDQAEKTLVNASRLFVNGELNKLAYDALATDETKKLNAATVRLVELEHEAPQARRGSRSDPERVLEQAGQWAGAFRQSDQSTQREVLTALIATIELHKAGYRKLRADITWTPAGDALAQVSDMARTA